MEVFQKLKAKLAEEPDSESDREPPGASGPRGTRRDPAGGGGGRAEELEREVQELKEHINKNYFVYVKRLEKRKERIKELEEYAKLLIKDNEVLQEKQKDFEECQKQLSEYRDNLEQLEGFQNQELAKVKHMLLSAESALEQERSKRRSLEEASSAGERAVRAGREAGEPQEEVSSLLEKLKALETREEETKRSHEEAVRKLEERIKVQNLGGDERAQALEKERSALDEDLRRAKTDLSNLKESSEKETAELRNRLSKAESERDAARTQTIEAEIAGHETREEAEDKRQRAREEADVATAKARSLEDQLRARSEQFEGVERELEATKIAFRQFREDADKDAQSKGSRVGALEAEVSLLKKKLSEEVLAAKAAAGRAQRSEEQREGLASSLKKKEAELAATAERLEKATARASLADGEAAQLRERLSVAEDQTATALIRLAALEEQLQAATVRATEAEDGEKRAREALQEAESTFDDRVQRTQVVTLLREKLQEVQDELDDKRKMVRLHQQRMLDMKKTFQREFRLQTGGSEVPNGAVDEATSEEQQQQQQQRPSRSPTPSAPSRVSPVPSSSSTSSQVVDPTLSASASPPTLVLEHQNLVTMSEVNFKYLKHVIFKFFTSPDPEAKHLTRAISALLRLTPDEERLLQQHLDWKTSWFGQKPKLGSGQFALSIDPQ